MAPMSPSENIRSLLHIILLTLLCLVRGFCSAFEASSTRIRFLLKNAEVLHIWTDRPGGQGVFSACKYTLLKPGPKVKKRTPTPCSCFRIHENPRYANDDVSPTHQVGNIRFPSNMFQFDLIGIIFVPLNTAP